MDLLYNLWCCYQHGGLTTWSQNLCSSAGAAPQPPVLPPKNTSSPHKLPYLVSAADHMQKLNVHPPSPLSLYSLLHISTAMACQFPFPMQKFDRACSRPTPYTPYPISAMATSLPHTEADHVFSPRTGAHPFPPVTALAYTAPQIPLPIRALPATTSPPQRGPSCPTPYTLPDTAQGRP